MNQVQETPALLPHILTIIQNFGHVSKKAPYLLEALFLQFNQSADNNNHQLTKNGGKMLADGTSQNGAKLANKKSSNFEYDAPFVYSCFLSTAVALFHVYPALCQGILSQIFFTCSNIKDYQLHLQLKSHYQALALKASKAGGS